MQQLIDDFLGYLRYERNRSPRTIEIYSDVLREYYQSILLRLSEADFSPSGADTDLIRNFLAETMDRGAKATYISQKLSAIKTFYRYLLKIEAIDKNPTIGLRAPKKERPLPVYVPTEYVEAIIAPKEEAQTAEQQLLNVRNRLLLSIIYECGLRRSEVAGLLDRNVDTKQRQLKVLGKGNKERIIPFGESLSLQIEQWRQKRDEYIGESETFFITLKGEPMTGRAVYSVVHEALQAVPNLSRRGAHALRHSFATDMLNAGADLVMLRELMGHSSVSTTVHYTHTSFKQLQQMYNAHPRAKKKG